MAFKRVIIRRVGPLSWLLELMKIQAIFLLFLSVTCSSCTTAPPAGKPHAGIFYEREKDTFWSDTGKFRRNYCRGNVTDIPLKISPQVMHEIGRSAQENDFFNLPPYLQNPEGEVCSGARTHRLGISFEGKSNVVTWMSACSTKIVPKELAATLSVLDRAIYETPEIKSLPQSACPRY